MTLRLAGCILLIIAAFLLGFSVGGQAGVRVTTCHAVTEDSAPYDCTYVHGEWVHR